MSDAKYIIYGLTDPRDGALRYVGQSCRGMLRPRRHSSKGNLIWNPHKINWIKKLESLGMRYGIVLIEDVADVNFLNEREIWWISIGRAWGCNLLNATDGGEGTRGWKMSEATKAKIGAAHRGKPKSPEHIARMIGRPVSKTTRAKMSSAARNWYNGPENKEKIRQRHELTRGKPLTGERLEIARACARKAQAARVGMKHSQEAIAKMSVSHRNMSTETRAKLSASHLGKKMSEETKTKLSAFWARRRVINEFLSTQQGPM
jgi:hypothetical protein